jgi:hypothetical protein
LAAFATPVGASLATVTIPEVVPVADSETCIIKWAVIRIASTEFGVNISQGTSAVRTFVEAMLDVSHKSFPVAFETERKLMVDSLVMRTEDGELVLPTW